MTSYQAAAQGNANAMSQLGDLYAMEHDNATAIHYYNLAITQNSADGLNVSDVIVSS